MIVFVPDYFPLFRCVAEQCTHTCCQGWEIDIDPATLARYQAIQGPLGKKLMECISLDPEPHFILREGDRCPFLTETRLCELILREGESSLCQICADHPRFRNYWSDRIEMGLGLACESAGRLILGSDHPLRLIRLEDEPSEEAQEPSEEEKQLMAYRDELLTKTPDKGPVARLKEYLIYRHLADALYDGQVEERLLYVDTAYQYILSRWDGHTLESLVQSARAFSNEYEYDDEGLEKLLIRFRS